MVVFTCQHCGESVKKAAVEKHYRTKCRFNSPYLTCVDCLKDFSSEDYNKHNQCMTEEQRYSAAGTVIKEFKGKKKQEMYIEMIKNILNRKDLTYVQRKLLQICSDHDNVPRKLPKFENFMKNVGHHVKCKPEDRKSVFDILEEAWEQEMQNINSQNKAQNSSLNGQDENEINFAKNGQSHQDKNDESINDLIETDSGKNKKKKLKDENLIDKEPTETTIVSAKEKKKRKKYEKYLSELERESKSGNQENSGDNHSESLPFSENKNSENLMESASELHSKKKKKRKLDENVCDAPSKKIKDTSCEEEEKIEAFNWSNVIVQVLQSRPEKELSLKKLGKKVVNHYQSVKPDHRSYEELLAKFNKKVYKTKGVRVLRDRAKLVE